MTGNLRAIGVSRGRPRALTATLVLIAVPVALALTEAVSFHVVNRMDTIVSSGRTREYLLHVPGNYDRGRPTPLVISLHGAGGWPSQQRDVSQWNRVADAHGFIVVYPSGVGGRGPRVWRATLEADVSEDVTFISNLIRRLEATYNVDRTRIYANGLSNGGSMAFVLSCTLSDRIAAVGMVAAAHLVAWSWCANSRPVPMIAIHGTADPLTPFDGGRTWVAPAAFPSIPAFTATWARRNRCESPPAESVVAADVARTVYNRCAGDAAVVLYRIEGAGHVWPGGWPLPEWLAGPNTSSLDASSVMWAFFHEYRLGK
jgi:polyhydroxybutyrate depolymerase